MSKKSEYKYLVGIDEVGRGPLAGPLTLAALVLLKNFKLPKFDFEIKDSKKLSEEKRNQVYKILNKLKKDGEICFKLSFVKNTLIDKEGLSKCLQKGVDRCLRKLDLKASEVKIFLDGGLKAPIEYQDQKTITKGDERIKIIALASIVAKVGRDRRMSRLAQKYPEYNFHVHKGYGTQAHYRALKKYGPSEIHRKSFLKIT